MAQLKGGHNHGALHMHNYMVTSQFLGGWYGLAKGESHVFRNQLP